MGCALPRARHTLPHPARKLPRLRCCLPRTLAPPQPHHPCTPCNPAPTAPPCPHTPITPAPLHPCTPAPPAPLHLHLPPHPCQPSRRLPSQPPGLSLRFSAQLRPKAALPSPGTWSFPEGDGALPSCPLHHTQPRLRTGALAAPAPRRPPHPGPHLLCTEGLRCACFQHRVRSLDVRGSPVNVD